MLGRSRAGAPPALCAGAAPPAPAPGPGHPLLPLLAPIGGAAPHHLRWAGRRGGWPGLPRGAAGGLHGAGDVGAARALDRGHVDGGPGVGPRHASQLRVPPLRRGARGRGPRPVGLPRVGRRQGDVAPLAERRGGSPSPTWAHRTGGPPACGERAFSPSGWHRGWTGTSSTSSCTAYMACTWRSSRLAWRPARGISRATATPSSRSSRARGPATPTRGTPSLAPYRGTPSATNRGCSRGCRRTGGGPKTSSTT